MHLSRALTLTEKLSLLAQLFIPDYIISEQGYYKYQVVPLTGGKNNHQKTWATYFYSTLPDMPYCYNLTCYRGSPPLDVYNSTEKHILQCTSYYRKSVLKKSHYRNYNIVISELCIMKFSFIF